MLVAIYINTVFHYLPINYKELYSTLLSVPINISKFLNIHNNIMGIRQVFRTKHLENNSTLTNNYLAFNSSLNFQLPR